MSNSAHKDQPASGRIDPWYVARALPAKGLHAALAGLAVVGLGACGEPRQDANEPAGKYRVSADASFPSGQKLAKRSQLVIKVRNEENRKAIPNVAVTLQGFSTRIKQEDVSDPSRPIFVINGRPMNIGTFPETKEDGPRGGETAYVDTWALGRLGPGKARTFKWDVTAVRAGPYRVTYRVAGGLDGKAKAVAVGGGPVRGAFKGRVSNTPPDTRVGDDGKSVVQPR